MKSMITFAPRGTVIVMSPCDAPLKFHLLFAGVLPAVIAIVAVFVAASQVSQEGC